MTSDKHKTYQNVFDRITIKSLERLTKLGHIKLMYGQIAEGKESHVFYAINNQDEPVAVKIFLFQALEFKKITKYITGDPRFRGLRKKRRSLIHDWARKEFQNMLRARDVGIRVPTPYALKNNVLVMEFIGKKGVPSPTAVNKPPRRKREWSRLIRGYIMNLWRDARLVHADLSGFNILNYDDEPVVIDWSSAVLRDHPLSNEFLAKDIKNSFKWLKSIGINPGNEEDFYNKVRESVQ